MRTARARAAAGRLRRTARTRLGARTIEDRLVWILGSPRSGSTWLLQLLSEHRAVVPVNEPLIGWHLGPFLSDLPGWDASSLDTGNFTLRRVQRHQPQQFFASEFSDVWLPAMAHLLRQRFAAHAVRYPPARGRASRAIVVVKEPAGSQSADILLQSLPRSRLLFLLRDGRDVVDSELAANLKGSWVEREFPGARGVSEAERLGFVCDSARRWLWRTNVVEEAFDAHPGPRHRLRYEELLAAPAHHLEALSAWLGLPFESRDIEATVARHAFERMPATTRGAESFFRAARPGGWRENLSDSEQRAVGSIIDAKLRELGYSP